MTIYRYEARLRFMLFRIQFWEKYEQLSKVSSAALSNNEKSTF